MTQNYPIESVNVRWVSTENIQQKCWNGISPDPARALNNPRACAVVNGGQCTIYAMKPAGWGDSVRVSDLGHELLHCFGYAH